jgi:hypothetical protein
MTSTRIQDALLDVRDAIEVPPPDDLAFRAVLRRARRGRVAGRVLVAACAVAVLGVGPALWLSSRPAGSPPDTSPPPAPASALQMFPASVHGRLETLLPDGSSYSTRERVEEVLGSGPAGIVVIDRDSHLLLVPLLPSGQPDRPRDLGDGRPVQRAWLDKSGQYVGFVDLADRLHLRALGSDADLASVALAPADVLLAVGDGRWLTSRAGVVTVGSPSGSVVLESGDPAHSAEIGGGTVAFETAAGVEFFASSDGRLRARTAGLGVGSLSPDGRWYVGAPGEEQLDAGAAPQLSLVDTRTGAPGTFAGPSKVRVLALTWQDDDRFLVLGTDPRQPGDRIAWDCSVALGRCVERFNDVQGTLQVATR